MQYITRVAIDLDLMRLITIGEEYFNEVSRWTNFSFSRGKVMRSAMFAIASKDHNIFMAVDDNNEILGFLWGCITGQIWSDDPVGHDVFLYVRPKFRGNGIAKDLVKMFLDWCQACGCKGVQMGANSGIQDDAPAVNMYKSLGFGSGGRCFNLQFKGE